MTNNTDDAVVKRIIKAYLHFHGEATARMIYEHINSVDYGLRKNYTPASLSRFMGLWSYSGKSGSWFRVKCTMKKHKKWWSLE